MKFDIWSGLTERSKEIRETWSEMHLFLLLPDLFFTVVQKAIIAKPGFNFNPRFCFCLSEVCSLLILAEHEIIGKKKKLSWVCFVSVQMIWIQISRYPCFEHQQTLTLSAYSEAIWEISSDWSPTMDPTVLDERAPLKKTDNTVRYLAERLKPLRNGEIFF